MKIKITNPLYTRDLAKILKVSEETARRKMNVVRTKTGLQVLSVGDYIRNSKTSPAIFGLEKLETNQI